MCERVQLLENSGKSRKNGEKIRGCQNHGLKKKLEMETIEYRNLRCQWFFDEKIALGHRTTCSATMERSSSSSKALLMPLGGLDGGTPLIAGWLNRQWEIAEIQDPIRGGT